MKRLQSLDSIRGIAILLVLIWHYIPRTEAMPVFVLQATAVFWSGVDLFFVLSGFLIGSIVLQNVHTTNFLKTFYIRRAARIVPLYLFLLFVFGVALYFHPKFILNSVLNHFPIWSYFTFTQNFFAATEASFGGKWMGITWSLAVEEQFYIFLSIVALVINKKHLTYLAGFLIVLAPILRFLAPNNIAAYVLPFHRADSLMLGVLLTLVWQWAPGKTFLKKHRVFFKWSFLFFLAGVVILSLNNTNIGSPLGHTWLAFFYANLVIMALTVGSDPRVIFRNSIFIWLGLRSYGIYLFHRPMVLISRYLVYLFFDFSLPEWGITVLAIVLTFLIAEIAYWILEKPFMALGHRFKYQQTITYVAQ